MMKLSKYSIFFYCVAFSIFLVLALSIATPFWSWRNIPFTRLASSYFIEMRYQVWLGLSQDALVDLIGEPSFRGKPVLPIGFGPLDKDVFNDIDYTGYCLVVRNESVVGIYCEDTSGTDYVHIFTTLPDENWVDIPSEDKIAILNAIRFSFDEDIKWTYSLRETIGYFKCRYIEQWSYKISSNRQMLVRFYPDSTVLDVSIRNIGFDLGPEN